MKTLIVLFITANLLLISSATFGASIRGSKHDFSSLVLAGGEVCIVCHTPHGSNQGSIDAPLWDHSITTQTFTPYTSRTMKAAVGQPDGLSKLCLSCHDGTVAIDSFNGSMGTTFIKKAIGPNLNSSSGHWKHPVSIVYDTSLSVADTRLYDPSTATTVLGGTIQRDLLKNNKLQCTSCHDVHNTSGIDKLLKINANDLCITCHNN